MTKLHSVTVKKIIIFALTWQGIFRIWEEIFITSFFKEPKMLSV